MSSMNLLNDFKNIEIKQLESMLGKGVLMPFNASNSGSRKLMFGTHLEHHLNLLNPEVAYVQTGYEKEYGKFSSSIVTVDRDLYVIAKIPKFSKHPKHHYFMLIVDEKDKVLDVVERKEYKHITENYGYLFNNELMDFLNEGDYIGKGTVVRKSTAYDEYDNREDGVNLLTCYTASEDTMEDGIILSESASKKLISPLIKRVPIMVNENNILLNVYGDNKVYKTFPDIGEDIKDGILAAIRLEKKEEMLYSQSWDRLREIFISDQPYTVFGKVVDINVYPNNIEFLNENEYLGQVKYYYNENLRMCYKILESIAPYVEKGYTMSYDLKALYSKCSKVVAGIQYFSDKVYNNISMEIVVIEELPVSRCDKISNRFGGKGVTSVVKPDDMMPRTKDGKVIDVQLNMNGVYGRENLGQLFEISASFNSIKMLEFFQESMLDIGQCVEYYLRFLEIVAPKFHDFVEKQIEGFSDEELFNYIMSMMDDKSLYLIIEPMTENMTIDTILKLYEEFPFSRPEKLMMPIVGSNGNIRYVESRRPFVYGYQYFYRLKQYAEEKFSVTSLSSTNVRNENSKNKASNSYKALFSRTPIRFGVA